MRGLLALLLGFALIGCGEARHDDLVEFVNKSGEGLRSGVEPLPEIKPYQAFSYEAFDLPDPFKPRKLTGKGGGGLQPDFNRRKELLEAYPLETMKMVGTLQQDKAIFALVKTPDNLLYRVGPGNYMGQSFGVVTAVTETEIKLKETVQDSMGDWTERESILQLQEEQEQKK